MPIPNLIILCKSLQLNSVNLLLKVYIIIKGYKREYISSFLENMDITPDETKFKKCRSTQTELDGELILEAKRIVENFKKIEKHWNTREERLTRTILAIGGILILLKIATKVM